MRTLSGFVVALALALHAEAQTEPAIRHTALQCLPSTQYAQVDAVIVPGVDVQTAKVYFRSDKYPDFYYVEMNGEQDNFQAILPKPAPETEKVIYYVEAVSTSFASARTAENDPKVGTEEECQRQGARYFGGAKPGIIVGAIRAGIPAIPSGFQAAGIAGFITAAGVASGAGSGIGAGTAIALGAAGAAGAAGVAVASTGGDGAASSNSSAATASTTTTTTAAVSSTSTSTSSTTTSVFNEAPKACVATTPPTPIVSPGEPIKFDASCSTGDRLQEDNVTSYSWDLGDGRTREGRVITVVYDTPGVYTVTLTVTDLGGNQDVFRFQVTVKSPVVPPTACFTARDMNPGFGCKMLFDGTCSTGDSIVAYDWVLDKYTLIGPAVYLSGQVVNYDWGFFCGANVTIELKVTTADGAFDVETQTSYISYLTNPFQGEREIGSSVGTFLGVKPFDGGARGEIVLNGARLEGVDNSAPSQLAVKGRPGENTIEAQIGSFGEGFWRFDFGGAPHFVLGSIKVEYGTVISLDARSVVFRLSGEAGERIRLTYQLLP